MDCSGAGGEKKEQTQEIISEDQRILEPANRRSSHPTQAMELSSGCSGSTELLAQANNSSRKFPRLSRVVPSRSEEPRRPLSRGV